MKDDEYNNEYNGDHIIGNQIIMVCPKCGNVVINRMNNNIVCPNCGELIVINNGD